MLRALLGLANNGTFNNPTFTGVAKFANGTVASPGIAFANGTSGWYWSGTTLNYAQGGNTALTFNEGSAGWDRMGVYIALGAGNAVGDTILARGSAGVFKFSSSASFTANGSIATTMSSLGPTGSHTTIQEWLTIQDAAGTTRYIPCY